MNSLQNNGQLFQILPNFLVFLLEKLINIYHLQHFMKMKWKKAIRNFDPNKAHGHDMLSITVLNICDESLLRPIWLIFQSCFENCKFPFQSKKGNVVPTNKKNDKQLVKNYRPISLLPICGKIFERLIYNKLFHFLQRKNLISPNQSGFKPGDSSTIGYYLWNI